MARQYTEKSALTQDILFLTFIFIFFIYKVSYRWRFGGSICAEKTHYQPLDDLYTEVKVLMR